MPDVNVSDSAPVAETLTTAYNFQVSYRGRTIELTGTAASSNVQTVHADDLFVNSVTVTGASSAGHIVQVQDESGGNIFRYTCGTANETENIDLGGEFYPGPITCNDMDSGTVLIHLK